MKNSYSQDLRIHSLVIVFLNILLNINAFSQNNIAPVLASSELGPNGLPIWRADEIYLKIKDNSNIDLSNFHNTESDSINELFNLFNKYGVFEVSRPFVELNTIRFDRTYSLKFTDQNNIEVFIGELENHFAVDYAEKIPIMYQLSIPNDPMPPYHLGLVNINGSSNIHIATGNAIIAIVDDAVLTTHEDLAANINSLNRDVADLDDDPNPPFNGPAEVNGTRFSHGTHVAGIAGAVTNNNLGVASIGWNNRLMCVKAKNDDDVSLAIDSAYAGVKWAMLNGAHVINMSWGSYGYSDTHYGIIKEAHNMNIVMIAAAGNDITLNPHYPAAYGEGTTGQSWESLNKNLVVAVAGLDANNDQSDWGLNSFGAPTGSNYGHWVDISAYGTAILSTIANSQSGNPINNQYANYNGTSMAAPIVAGIAGVMKSYDMTKSADDIINCILYTANTDIYNTALHPNNIFGTLGIGRVDAEAALRCMGVGCNNPIAVITPSSSTICPNGNVTLSANLGASYLWSTGATTKSISISQPGEYTVTITFPGGCTATKSIVIPAADTQAHIVVTENSGLAANDGILCGTDMLRLSAYYGLSYQWGAFGATTASIPGTINAGPNLPFTWTVSVTITGVGGCPGIVSTATKTIEWLALPSIIATADPSGICIGESSTLTASGASTYNWKPINVNGNPVIVSPTTTTTYTATGIDGFGCENTDEVTVTATQQSTTISISPSGYCANTPVNLTASAGTGFTYQWQLNGVDIAGATSSVQLANGIGDYTVKAISGSCTVTSPIVSAIISSGPMLIKEDPSCDPAKLYNLKVKGEGDYPPYTFLWSTGETSEEATGLSIGQGYTVTVTDAIGCTGTALVGLEPFTFISSDYIVTGTEDWTNSNVIIEGRVSVAPSGQLTISNSTVHFLYGFTSDLEVPSTLKVARLEISPNGRLYVQDNSILMGCNDEIWDGIEVRGKPSTDLKSIEQGDAWILSGSTIKNAKIGVITDRQFKVSPGNTSGGIVYAKNANFINNMVGLSLNIYNHDSYQTFGNSSVEFCNFEYNSSSPFYISDDPNSEPEPAKMNFVELNDLRVVSFNDNNFNSFIPDADMKFHGNGIVANNAKIRLVNPGLAPGNNNFYGLFNAVSSQSFNGTSQVYALGNNFNYNVRGINISGGNADIIRQNKFIGIPSGAKQITGVTSGIKLVSSGGFKIEDNEFEGFSSINPYVLGSHGIVFENTGAQAGLCFKNSFMGTDFGVHTQMDNQALKIRCNEFATNGSPHSASAWYTYNGTLKHQGLPSCINNEQDAAGNKWLSTCSNEQAIFTGIQFNYYANPFDESQATTTVPSCNSSTWTGLNTSCLDATSLSCFDGAAGLPPNPGGGNTEWVTKIKTLTSIHNTQLIDFRNQLREIKLKTDGGNTTDLINFINKTPAASANELRTRILASLPLSEEAIQALIKRKVHVPPNYLKEMLLPNSPLSGEVMKSLMARVPALPANSLKEIELAQGNPPLFPKRKDLEEMVSWHSTEIRLLENDLYAEFTHLNMAQEKEDLLRESFNSESKKLLSLHLLEKKDYVGSLAALEEVQLITEEEVLTQTDEIALINKLENQNFDKYLRTIINVSQSERTIYEITVSEKQVLHEVADAKVKVSANAEIILTMLEGFEYDHPVFKQLPASDRSIEIEETNSESELKEFGSNYVIESTNDHTCIKAYPNPFSSSTKIKYFVSGKSEVNSLNIYNIHGQLIRTYPIDNGYGEFEIDGSKMENGFYWCNLISQNGIMGKTKLVIIK